MGRAEKNMLPSDGSSHAAHLRLTTRCLSRLLLIFHLLLSLVQVCKQLLLGRGTVRLPQQTNKRLNADCHPNKIVQPTCSDPDSGYQGNNFTRPESAQVAASAVSRLSISSGDASCDGLLSQEQSEPAPMSRDLAEGSDAISVVVTQAPGVEEGVALETDSRDPAAFAEQLTFAHADSDCDESYDGQGEQEVMAANSTPCRSCRRQQQQQTGQATLPHRSASLGQRLRVCQELVATERKYCCCLKIIIDLLGESVKAAACISIKDLVLIFPKSLPRLRELHSAFLARLEERLLLEATAAMVASSAMPQTQPGAFSSVVLDFLDANNGELFLMYREYVNDFGCAVRTLRKCQQRSAHLRRLLHCLQCHPSCEGLDVIAFLLTPVQRPPRYLLLLSQIQAYTPAGHPDLPCVTGALARLRSLLDELNVSIHTALRQVAPSSRQHQQQQVQGRRAQGSRNPFAGSASCESLQMLGRLVARRDSFEEGNSSVASANPMGNQQKPAQSQHHFLDGGIRRRLTQPDLMLIYSCGSISAASRSRSQLMSPGGVVNAAPATSDSLESTSSAEGTGLMGPRSRAISRQLRVAGRCRSAGDTLRPPGTSPVLLIPAPLATGDEEPLWSSRRRTQSSSRDAAGALKESLRRMFMPKRKSIVTEVNGFVTSGDSSKESARWTTY